MKYIKYFFQFLVTIIIFLIFKMLGPNWSSKLSGKLFEIIGPFFRSKKIIYSNITKAYPDSNEEKIKKIAKLMWNNYGRVFSEYMFIKDFRFGKLANKIEINGKKYLDEIRNSNKQVVFVSGHFSNFELMAMCIEKSGIELTAIYRPLNNIFLNIIIEKIRNKYICKNQIKKGLGGLKKLINFKNKNYSTALMIDQRVSEGILSNFFNIEALTTTMPAQLVKKYNIPVVPVYIERIHGIDFRLVINKPIIYSKNDTIQSITDDLNTILEKMILKRPGQWIWSHNRWK